MVHVPDLRTPPVDLPPNTAPETTTYWPGVRSMFYTGTETVTEIIHQFCQLPGQRVAMDIETRGLDLGRWSINCVTASFRLGDGSLHSVLLNPMRCDKDRELMRMITAKADSLVFHNSVFDIPPLYAHKLISFDEIRKVEDTMLLARMLNTIQRGGRTLEDLSQRYAVAVDSSVKITDAFLAAGFKKQEDGYTNSDIHMPFYRAGAMSDTAVTLQLWEKLYPLVIDVHTKGAPNSAAIAMLSRERAEELVNKIQRVNQITLQTSARGLSWDQDYMNTWYTNQEEAIERASASLSAAGLEPGRGDKLIQFLSDRGELPGDWPRTDKGALKADKKAMERLTDLGHPLTQAHTVIAEYQKNSNYLTKISESASTTGRVHPSTGVLGAQASGRMCLPSDYLVYTLRGPKPVSEIEPGKDFTFSRTGAITPIRKVHHYPDSETVTWETDSGLSLVATAEHRWITQSGEVRALGHDDAGLAVTLRPSTLSRGHETRIQDFADNALFAAMTVNDTHADVWCVSTDDGTFTAWHPDGFAFLTGNSVQDPPLQQFSKDARPVICSDGEDWWSVDWSSIEPVVLANCAGDIDFLREFNEGGDLYIPLARSAGLIPSSVSDAEAKDHPGRKQAKVMLLAAMYGQGIPSLASSMGVSLSEAYRINDGIKRSMQRTFSFMESVQQSCKWSGASWTIFGRMLNETYVNGDVNDRVAVNHFCQGSSCDVLMNAVLELDNLGMASEIRMLIHDEIVITEEGLEACKEVMRTPPEALLEVAARKNMDPVIRIDAQNMGKHWQKV